MLTLSGTAGHQRRSWGVFNFTEEEVIVFFHQTLPSENKTETRRETLPMEKKIHIEAEKDEIGGMQFCFYEII